MEPELVTIGLLLADYVIRIGLSLRVVMRRLSVGVSLAWLLIVLSAPIAGAAVYLLFGELRLGHRRARWLERIHPIYEKWSADLRARYPIAWTGKALDFRPFARLIETIAGMPVTPDNRLQLLSGAEPILRSILADIDRAERFCNLEFYIWAEGGTADEVADALLRAAKRGVTCRVLLDAVGSRPMLRSALAQRLREGGVQVHTALPVGLLRMFLSRLDLRLHRKIVVIDWRVAYTGSLNIVDPRYFKQNANVGQWVDAMVRVEGPVVECLGAVFAEDWYMETEGVVDMLTDADKQRLAQPHGPSYIQAIPTGPLVSSTAAQEMLLMAMYAAQRELIMTTPYFVPDESILTALVTAARRGVEVTLILPARVDSLLVRLASQAHKEELLKAGVRIAQFDGGLLHTKSITVDGRASLFGSLNLDPRSLRLNFEITLAVYDETFTGELRALQQSYLADARWTSLQDVRQRSYPTRLAFNAARLVAPLL